MGSFDRSRQFPVDVVRLDGFSFGIGFRRDPAERHGGNAGFVVAFRRAHPAVHTDFGVLRRGDERAAILTRGITGCSEPS
ncbi:hypothetical protein [Nocardia tenerifensis]|uniref:hypothetical protein n=1 Tax=Nocardia tenerifensis TaxID=228006 RepID=UPI0011B4428B|nr:hypothetical protein [Nocardia tenerifensis]